MLECDSLTNFFMAGVYFPAEEDAALVRQSLAGETSAFGVLVTRYQRVLYTVAVRMLGNAEDARDATQEAFVKAYQRLATFDPAYRFFSWIYRILVNECLNVIRGRHPQEPLATDLAAAGNPFETAAAQERRVQVEAALQQLSPEYRAVIVLRHFVGNSYSEIADALSIPERTVKSRLYAARQMLGERLLGWREE
jgi:RNA polymerase sigma-70 factor (ECF subfamily)